MNKVILNFFFCCFFFFLISPGLSSQPTEKALLKVWESIQKNDPQTLVFEKLAENHYKFKTKKFPFDGELKILNISIDEAVSEYADSVIWGVVEVELVDLPNDFYQKYSYSYSRWQENNTLYFDNETQEWLSSKEYHAKRRKKRKDYSGGFIDILFSSIYNVVFFGILIILLIFMRRIRKKTDESVQKSFAFSEETNRLLKEILEELRKK